MKKILIALVCLSAASGCASAPRRPAPGPPAGTSAAQQLHTLQHKFDLARRENNRLKEELTLYRRAKTVDSSKFMEAADVLSVIFSKEIAAREIGVTFTDRGLAVTLLAEKLFVSGSASLSDEGKAHLDGLQQTIVTYLPKNYIFIEGHTDNQSLAVFEWKSDWEFSFARALSVLRYFTEIKKMSPWQLAAAGFGRYRPRDTNDTKEGRRMNRRIDIVIAPQHMRMSG